MKDLKTYLLEIIRDAKEQRLSVYDTRKKFIERVEKFYGRKFLEVRFDELECFFEEEVINNDDANLVSAKISQIFLSYHNLKVRNENNFILKQAGRKVTCISEEEFFDKYGTPPWVTLNEALKVAGLNYQVSSPNGDEEISSFLPKIINTDKNLELNFSELSSGERILFKLSMSIFNSHQYSSKLPQLLLLDEVDASLHPEMIFRLYNLLNDFFIKKCGINIILATHSPTTVAMADEKSIFCMINGELRKTPKQIALSNLLAGVDAIRVLYENRKHIFVESKYDVEFYEKLSDIIFDRTNIVSALNFISSGNEGSGSSTQTRSIVRELQEKGIPSVYGIIDWDSQNKHSNHIYVLEEGVRYSRENYTLDPLFIGLLIIRNQFFDRDDAEWFRNTKLIDIHNANNEFIQNIYDYILINKLNVQDDNRINCILMNGYTIKCSQLLLHKNGHAYAEGLLKSINAFGRYQGKVENLERDIYNKVFKEFCGLIYKSACDMLMEINSISMSSM